MNTIVSKKVAVVAALALVVIPPPIFVAYMFTAGGWGLFALFPLAVTLFLFSPLFVVMVLSRPTKGVVASAWGYTVGLFFFFLTLPDGGDVGINSTLGFLFGYRGEQESGRGHDFVAAAGSVATPAGFLFLLSLFLLVVFWAVARGKGIKRNKSPEVSSPEVDTV